MSLKGCQMHRRSEERREVLVTILRLSCDPASGLHQSLEVLGREEYSNGRVCLTSLVAMVSSGSKHCWRARCMGWSKRGGGKGCPFDSSLEDESFNALEVHKYKPCKPFSTSRIRHNLLVRRWSGPWLSPRGPYNKSRRHRLHFHGTV